jgi:tRNA pseudouridine32 synthase/23S rRNA pseudouridine746 synthase
MMQGLSLQNITPTAPDNPVIIHEDDAVIVVEKPSGMPSVPGLDGRLSLQEWLTRHAVSSEVHSVHRLDMDTSGVMVFAKTSEAAVHLRRQFEEHTVRKTYVARLASQPLLRCKSENPQTETVGVIELPLCPDYDERPRQKVDFKQGKPAHTDYRILQTNHDGTTDILLYPLTGRTHQLRVHCAHNSGLARPIAGDLLYGAYTAESSSVAESRSCPSLPSRLCLHALSITFTHPLTDEPQTFTSDRLSY